MSGEALLPVQIIAAKRDGRVLTPAQIRSFVRGARDRSWPDYQLSALLMAITLRGMTPEETAELTQAVVESGKAPDLSAIRRPKVDKHSTGGVGDKVSLVLAPLAVACGLAVPMVSGRGLGHTGGTLDKLEAIAGFRVDLSLAEYAAQIGKVGAALVGQSAEFAPADKTLYALRDVTATVESIPLICASIMGKKLAEGIDSLVLDVKFGSGAFMAERDRARELARAMVAIGSAMAKPVPVRAVLTAMEQPLGRTVGNALEVREAVECLRGEGPKDVMEVTYALGEQMLLLAGVAGTKGEARMQLDKALISGKALEVFREIVRAQGGDVGMVDDVGRLPAAPVKQEVRWPRAADVAAGAGGGADVFVQAVDAKGVAMAALRLGAGRLKAGEPVDHAVGIGDLIKVGEKLPPGGRVCVVHAKSAADAEREAKAILEAIKVGEKKPVEEPLIAEVISD